MLLLKEEVQICIQPKNALNCNNHMWRLANLSPSFTRGREGRLPPQQDTYWKSEWAPLNWKISPLYQWFGLVFFQLLPFVACTNKQNHHTLLLYSFTCKCPYSNVNSEDLTWCLNISSLLMSLYFEYWKIHFPSENRWCHSNPNWIVDYTKKIGLWNIYWMHIKP